MAPGADLELLLVRRRRERCILQLILRLVAVCIPRIAKSSLASLTVLGPVHTLMLRHQQQLREQDTPPLLWPAVRLVQPRLRLVLIPVGTVRALVLAQWPHQPLVLMANIKPVVLALLVRAVLGVI